MRKLGEKLRPCANGIADFVMACAHNPKRQAGGPVCLPFSLANQIILLLAAMPAARAGRPRKDSTNDLTWMLDNQGVSKRGVARTLAAKTGEDEEALRRRMRPPGPPRKKRKKPKSQ
jgi:hypothetical protein